MAGERKRRAGRPSSLTPEVQETICNAIAGGATFEDACVFAGVGVSTFMRWKQLGEGQKRGRYREFLDAVERARVRRRVALLAGIAKAGKEPKHWTANAWLLERDDPKRYSKQVRVHVEEELSGALERIRQRVPADVYEQVLVAITAGDVQLAGDPEHAVAGDGGAEPDPAGT